MIKILVVEDEGVVAKDLQIILRNLGYEVPVIVFTGEDAIKKAREIKPDLVLIDIVLRGEIDGIEAAEIIQEQYNIPVIYLTAYGDDKTLERAKITVPFGYIIKPFKDRELHSTIEMALYKHRIDSKLKQNQAWLSATLKSIGDAIITTDREGLITFMNPVAESLTGWKAKNVYGKSLETIFNIVNEITGKPIENPSKQILHDGEIVNLGSNTILIARDGTEVPIDDNIAPIKDNKGNINGIVIVFHDISERKKAEKALEESREAIKTITENVNLGIYRSTTDDLGKFIEVNPALVKMLGYDSRKDLMQKDIIDIYDDPEKRTIFKELMTRKNFVKNREEQLKRKDGSTFTASISAVAIKNKKNEIKYFDGIIEDISHRKQIEFEKETLEAQLHQQQKLESIGTLASGVAHEINNPITGIINYAQLIMDRTLVDSIKEFSQGIIDEGERVANIVRNLLSFARQDNECHSPAYIQDIISDSLSLFRTVLRRDQIILEQDIPKDLPKIKCRSQQIQQVIINILTNARDALNSRYKGFNDNKVVKISASLLHRNGTDWIRTTIEDHGSGIDQETIDRIFDPFFTTKPRDKGTGLGLSVSYGIIKKHQGKLSVESERDRYSKFHMDLLVDNKWNLKNAAQN